MRNPRALRQVSIDDYSETIAQAVSAGELYLSDREAALLARRADAQASAPFGLARRHGGCLVLDAAAVTAAGRQAVESVMLTLAPSNGRPA
jgi:hypothetical protein